MPKVPYTLTTFTHFYTLSRLHTQEVWQTRRAVCATCMPSPPVSGPGTSVLVALGRMPERHAAHGTEEAAQPWPRTGSAR